MTPTFSAGSVELRLHPFPAMVTYRGSARRTPRKEHPHDARVLQDGQHAPFVPQALHRFVGVAELLLEHLHRNPLVQPTRPLQGREVHFSKAPLAEALLEVETHARCVHVDAG